MHQTIFRDKEKWAMRIKSSAPTLYEKSDLRGSLAVARDWFIIATAICMAEWSQNWITTIAAIWVIGSQQYALGEALVHEASHKNLFRSGTLNDRLQFLFAWPFFRTLEGYRKWHFPHHRFLGADGDPLQPRYQELGQKLHYLSVIKIWLLEPILGVAGARFLFSEVFDADRRELLAGIAVNLCFVVFAFSVGHLDGWFLYWAVPFLWVFPAFYHWQEIEDHFLCTVEGRVMTGKIRGFLHHNAGYHHIHHLCPGIPFFHLKSAYKLIDVPDSDKSDGFWDSFLTLLRATRRPKLRIVD